MAGPEQNPFIWDTVASQKRRSKYLAENSKNLGPAAVGRLMQQWDKAEGERETAAGVNSAQWIKDHPDLEAQARQKQTADEITRQTEAQNKAAEEAAARLERQKPLAQKYPGLAMGLPTAVGALSSILPILRNRGNKTTLKGFNKDWARADKEASATSDKFGFDSPKTTRSMERLRDFENRSPEMERQYGGPAKNTVFPYLSSGLAAEAAAYPLEYDWVTQKYEKGPNGEPSPAMPTGYDWLEALPRIGAAAFGGWAIPHYAGAYGFGTKPPPYTGGAGTLRSWQQSRTPPANPEASALPAPSNPMLESPATAPTRSIPQSPYTQAPFSPVSIYSPRTQSSSQFAPRMSPAEYLQAEKKPIPAPPQQTSLPAPQQEQAALPPPSRITPPTPQGEAVPQLPPQSASRMPYPPPPVENIPPPMNEIPGFKPGNYGAAGRGNLLRTMGLPDNRSSFQFTSTKDLQKEISDALKQRRIK